MVQRKKLRCRIHDIRTKGKDLPLAALGILGESLLAFLSLDQCGGICRASRT